MKRIIRQNIFETNSSSTHSLIWMNEEEFKRWNNNELYISNSIYSDPIKYSEEEVNEMRQKIIKERGLQKLADEIGVLVEDLIINDYEGLPLNKEEFENKYDYLDTAEYFTNGLAGEKIIAYCIYGRDD